MVQTRDLPKPHCVLCPKGHLYGQKLKTSFFLFFLETWSAWPRVLQSKPIFKSILLNPYLDIDLALLIMGEWPRTLMSLGHFLTMT